MLGKLHDLWTASTSSRKGRPQFPGHDSTRTKSPYQADGILHPEEACPVNATMFQGFEWYVPADHRHWKRLQSILPQLKGIGIDKMWIPPGCKARWRDSNGYDIYDLYDLGEFDWKGLRATKWGTKEELIEMADAASKCGIGILWDAVLNHKAGADYTESFHAVKVDPTDRLREIDKPKEIEAWTGFNFPGRGEKYSSMKYHWHHFSGVDRDMRTNERGVFKFVGAGKQGWAEDVSGELGNYDYLMFADVDYSQPDVRMDVLNWGEWLGKEVKLSGVRLDAIKHYSEDFLRTFIRHLDETVGKDWLYIGEYWTAEFGILAPYIARMGGRMSLFDVQLVHNLSFNSKARRVDLRRIFDGTLAKHRPRNAVTFVQNHDTQECQSLEAAVEPWFVPLAYAFILLQANRGYPCVFYGDLYGIRGPKPRPPACDGKLPKLVLARKLYAYGPQTNYFERADCVGWTRSGHAAHSDGAGLAVMLNSGWRPAHKRMCVGQQHAGERWTDILGHLKSVTVIDRKGRGVFPVRPRSLSVWVNALALNRAQIDHLNFDSDIYKV